MLKFHLLFLLVSFFSFYVESVSISTYTKKEVREEQAKRSEVSIEKEESHSSKEESTRSAFRFPSIFHAFM